MTFLYCGDVFPLQISRDFRPKEVKEAHYGS
jgi:hypothetical protein